MSNTFSPSLENTLQTISRAWLVCFLAGLFFLYEFIQLSSFDALNQYLQHYYHINASKLGLLGSAFLWGNVVFLLPAGFLLDKIGPRKSILLSLALAIVGMALFAFSSSYKMAFLGRFLTGIGNAFCFIGMVVLVSRWFPATKQAFATGILVNMAFLGGMFAHTPLVWLLGKYGFKQMIWGNVAFGLIIWVLIFLFVLDGKSSMPVVSNHAQVSFKKVFLKIFNFQNFGAGFFTSCLNLPILVLCALWGIQYLQVAHHLSMLEASNVVSMIFLGSIFGCPLFGLFSDQMQKRKSLMWLGGLVSLLISLPLCVGHVHLSLHSLMAIFFILGFFTSAQVLSYPLLAESNSSQFAGRACSFASMIIMGGGMVAQMVFGALLSGQTKPGEVASPEAFHYAMWMFPLCIIASLIVLSRMKETYCRNHLEL